MQQLHSLHSISYDSAVTGVHTQSIALRNARVLNNDAFLYYKEVHDPEKSLLKKAWKRVLIVVAEEAN